MEIPDDKISLFAAYLGGRPEGAHIEQHDLFFGVGPTIEFLYPAIRRFWPAATKNIHIDAWMRIDHVGEYGISLRKLNGIADGPEPNSAKLYFVNLGGYRPGVLGEDHKPLLIVAATMADALRIAKDDPFITDGYSIGDAKPHVDDKLNIEGFDENDGALDITALMQRDGYIPILKRDGEDREPVVNISGFLRIPATA